MTSSFDVIVVGLGAMGSSAISHLARRGLSVLGIDQHSPPHSQGSTHGQTRIIREAYFEHPLYVPLVRQAYRLWDELAAATGTEIYRRTGGLMLGPEDGLLISGSRTSAVAHEIQHEMLSASEVRRRFPGFTPPVDFVGLWEDRAGLVFPERSVEVYLRLAGQYGAEVITESRVLGWNDQGGGIRVRTTTGDYHGRRVVLAAGPWIPALVGSLGSLFWVERQVFHWFAPDANISNWPVALWEHRRGGLFFTLPDGMGRIKAGIHHEGERVTPDTVMRSVTREDESRLRTLLLRYQAVADGPPVDAGICLYTNTPDGHFIIDWLPGEERVLVVSPCSGHGFKFASVIGEIVADLVTSGGSAFDLTPFQFARFG